MFFLYLLGLNNFELLKEAVCVYINEDAQANKEIFSSLSRYL